MKKLTILAGASLLVMSGGVAAQDLQGPTDEGAPMESADAETTADPMADDTMATAPDAAPSEAAPDAAIPAPNDTAGMTEAQAFTDEEVQSFAAADLQIQGLQGDANSSQEQAASIVASSGLDAETFNAIGSAMQTDPELAERVQLAAAELQGQTPG